METKAVRLTAILFLAALLVIQATSAYAISWLYKLDAAFEEAKRLNKPIMADFYTEWCGWCEKLDKDTYSDKGVAGLAAEFVCVKVDGDKNAAATAKYGVQGYPTIIFFTSKGEVIERITGYVGPDVFEQKMDAVLKKSPKEADKKGVTAKIIENIKGISNPFELNGIVYDPKTPTAVINNTIVSVGDTVGGAEVMEINRLSVKLRYQGRDIVLNLNN